mmetsp:Transcript_42025/g.116024  ORF Transcript_42025/g.116024 Transcript_42025/m.116024 type:complete len:408 (-) Transcript_42025:254-1477(-)
MGPYARALAQAGLLTAEAEAEDAKLGVPGGVQHPSENARDGPRSSGRLTADPMPPCDPLGMLAQQPDSTVCSDDDACRARSSPMKWLGKHKRSGTRKLPLRGGPSSKKVSRRSESALAAGAGSPGVLWTPRQPASCPWCAMAGMCIGTSCFSKVGRSRPSPACSIAPGGRPSLSSACTTASGRSRRTSVSSVASIDPQTPKRRCRSIASIRTSVDSPLGQPSDDRLREKRLELRLREASVNLREASLFMLANQSRETAHQPRGGRRERKSLAREVAGLAKKRNAELATLERYRKEQFEIKQKLKRCREVVEQTVNNIDRVFDDVVEAARSSVSEHSMAQTLAPSMQSEADAEGEVSAEQGDDAEYEDAAGKRTDTETQTRTGARVNCLGKSVMPVKREISVTSGVYQ